MENKRIMIVAGEPSGDVLGGRLMAALKELTAGAVTFSGVGGTTMQAGGLTSLFPMVELSVMGFAEVVPRIPHLLRRIRETADAALALRPDVLVTIDAPAFSFRVGRRLEGKGIPLVHYVAPQVWAWRPGRAAKIARFLDHLMALLPFEPPLFEQVGLPCTYVGHPAVETAAHAHDGPGFRGRHNIPGDAPLLAVLPGSRAAELSHHLPVFKDCLSRLVPRVDNLHAVTTTVPDLLDRLEAEARSWPLPTVVVSGEVEKFAAFAAAEAALAVSGTVVLELALARVPTVAAYRTSVVSGWIARRLVSLDAVTLPNLLLERVAVPEFLLGECRAAPLADAVREILVDRVVRDAQSRAADEVAEKLALDGVAPSRRAAKVVLDVIEKGPRRPSA